MSRILVWDLPTRLFHWLFTATVLGALAIALIADDDRSIFQVHMLLGLIAGFKLFSMGTMKGHGSSPCFLQRSLLNDCVKTERTESAHCNDEINALLCLHGRCINNGNHTIGDEHDVYNLGCCSTLFPWGM